MLALIYVFFNIQTSSKFPKNKFNKTLEWKNFCNFLNNKDPEDIKKKIYSLFKLN